jgi:rsbT co-antagonist protein RsbR
MSDAAVTSSGYGEVFDACPDPLAIVENDTIVARNAAFQRRFEDGATILTALRAGEHGAVTSWPAGEGKTCLRIDGAPKLHPDIPAALAPLFADGKPLSLPAILAGKMYEKMEATVWAIAKDGTIVVSDGSGLARYDIKPGQLVGLNALQIYPPGSVPRHDCDVAFAGGSIRADQVDGNDYWLRAVEPVRDADGNVTAMLGFAWCVTDNTQETIQAKALLGAMAELPVAIWAMDPDGTCSLSVGKGLEELGFKQGMLVGKNLFEFYASKPDYIALLERGLAGDQFINESQIGDMYWRNHYIPARDVFGDKVKRVYGVAENITERTQNERRLQEQLELIQSQRQAIATLTSPIIEVWQGVVVVPVIGNLDGDRAGRMLERLLTEVVARQSHSVILDLTGVDVVDTATAQHLFNIMRSVELIGATGLVSGIRPSVAKTMVELDISLASRKTFPTLAQALRRLITRRPA